LFSATKATGIGRWNAAEIVVQSLGSEERTVVWRGGRDPRYVPTGHIVYAQGTTLFAVPFDLARREVRGTQMPLVAGLSTPAGGALASDTAQYAVSDAGSLVYLTGGLVPTVGSSNRPPPRTLAWVDRKGGETPVQIRPDDYTMARISPDGRKIALVLGNPIPQDSNTDIWVYDLGTENSRQLTFEKGDDDAPVWTPDSSRLYFRSLEEGATNNGAVYSVSADGGARTLVAKSGEHPFAMPWSLSPDARTLALVSARSFQEADLALLDVQGKDAFQMLLRGPQLLTEPVIAPNGHWVAYMEGTTPAGPAEINIRSFPDVSRQRYPIATGAGAVFSRDGSELFFFDGNGMSAVSVGYQPTIRIGAVQRLFRGQYWYGVGGPNGALGRAWDVDRRGDRFLMIRMPGAVTTGSAQAAPPPVHVNVVLNWLNEVKARVSQ
jgi:dipeptidyl aminopeptidase/acylaminoacyl peptidase